MSEGLKRITELILRYYDQQEKLSLSEEIELNDWLGISDDNSILFGKFSDPEYAKEQLRLLENSGKEEARERVFAHIPDARITGAPVPIRGFNRAIWKRYIAAASLIGALATGAWIWSKYLSDNRAAMAMMTSKFGNDVLPGGNKATLTLADGSKILLAEAAKGMIAHQGNAKIEKLDNGQLSYNASDEKPGEIVYNTLTTPASGQFQLVLPDGTRVWLNNASSLRYPTAFVGDSRKVELAGEAYFEVAPNPAQPFKVKFVDQTVDVLGTSFNVMAYGDEQMIKTTLLTGAVKVSRGNESLLLKPGEQAQSNIAAGGDLKVLKNIDADGVIAWKNGLFHFERADLRAVMRVLARWYDVSVVYEGPVTDHLYGGDIQRNLNLSQVLDILQRNQVHFSIENRKITVRP